MRTLVVIVALVAVVTGCGGRDAPGAPAAARAADGWLAWTDPAGVSVRAPGGRVERHSAPHPIDLPADAEPDPLGSVADGLLVAVASAPAASGGPQSIFLVTADGTTRRLLDGDAEPEGEVTNVPVSVPAVRQAPLAYATGGRSGMCGAGYGVHLLDTGTGRDTPVGMPEPEGPDRAWAVRSLAWSRDGLLTAVLASIPAGGVCVSEPTSPSVWRLEGTRWVRQDRRGLLAAPGPGGRLALVTGQVTDQGEVLGNGELVLIGPDGTREPLGRGVRELLWAPA